MTHETFVWNALQKNLYPPFIFSLTKCCYQGKGIYCLPTYTQRGSLVCFPTTHSGERAWFHSYQISTEVCWRLLLSLLDWEENCPSLVYTHSSFSRYCRVKSSLVFGEINTYTPGARREVGKTKTPSIGFCPNRSGLQGLECGDKTPCPPLLTCIWTFLQIVGRNKKEKQRKRWLRKIA